MSDILDIVLRDEENIATEIVPITTDDSIAHYGRLGMKWYQHIYGDYQGAAKYAEKGAKKVDRLQEKGKISAAKRLRKQVDKFLSIAEKQKEMSAETKRKIAESVNEHSSDKEVQAAAKKIQKFEETSKASDAIIDELRQDRINDLTRGIGDWKKASSEDISAAITRLTLEKQYKEIRDEVSGAKVWKDAGKKALESVAGSAGKILEEVVKTQGNIAEEKNKANIAAEKDARTWARDDETHARDRKEKLADQAREDKNAELKAQRDIAKEEAKNRADYLNAQTKAAEFEWQKETDSRKNRLDDESDVAIREVLEGKRSESSLTPGQTNGMQDYVERLFGKDTTPRQVIDKYENDRQQAKAKVDAEEKAQRDFEDQNERAAKAAYDATRSKREQAANVAEQEMARRQKAHDEAERQRAKEAREDAQKATEKDTSLGERLQAFREKKAEKQRQQDQKEKDAAFEEYRKRQDEANDRNKKPANNNRSDLSGAIDYNNRSSNATSDLFGAGGKSVVTPERKYKTAEPIGSINDKLTRQLAELSKHAVSSKAVADSVDTGSSLVDRLLGRRSSGSFDSYDSRNAKIKSFINGGGSWADAEKKFGVSSSTISDVLGHSNVPVFRRMSREEFYANYKGLKWKSS